MPILEVPFQSMYSKASVHISAKYYHVLIDIAWLKHLFSSFPAKAIVTTLRKRVICPISYRLLGSFHNTVLGSCQQLKMGTGCKILGGYIFCDGWLEGHQKHLNILPQICMSDVSTTMQLSNRGHENCSCIWGEHANLCTFKWGSENCIIIEHCTRPLCRNYWQLA